MRHAAALGAVALIAAGAACATAGGPSAGTPGAVGAVGAAPVPRLVVARGEWLAESRRRLAAGDSVLRPAYQRLLADAESALTMTPPSVTQKRTVPPSGDRHDYLSLAPYWWPDTTRPDGLPYVRRDGVVNPASRTDHDGWRLAAMADAVEALALAHWFTAERRYADRAGVLLRAWFVDTATRMNPHLRFGQAVLGVSEGRGFGILDTRRFAKLVDAIRLLDGTAALSAAERATIDGWFRQYLTWLGTSDHGMEERLAQNNHGTWYDAQVVAIALFLGDTAAARAVLEHSAKRRIAAQIAADGRQAEELARTRPLHYSLFNLDAFTQLAEMGRHVGVDLWRYQAPSGGGLAPALRFVAPYADPAVEWPTEQVTPAGPDAFAAPLERAAAALGDAELARALSKLPPARLRERRSLLLYPGAYIPGERGSTR